MSSSISATIFRQYDVRGIVGKDLTSEVAYALGRGFAQALADRQIAGAVAIGRDNRPSGNALRDALVQGLLDSGYDVVDVGIVPTPVLYWTLHHEPVVAGIQITGSHNPPEYNGFKISIGKGSMHGEEIQELYRTIVANRTVNGQGRVRQAEVIDRYIADVAQKTGPLPRKLKVVYDCGNGVGAVVAPQMMQALGLSDAIGLFTESDGSFPNHHPDPTVPENLEDLIHAVKQQMKETHAPIAGEMSGHMFFTEGFYGHDDALYGAARLLRIVAESGKRVDEMLADVPHYVSTPELRIEVDEEKKFPLMDEAVAAFRATHEVIDVDGVRVLFGDGWGLMRASNTQPVIVMRFEARSEERLQAIKAEMDGWLRARGVAV
ncbi:MAG: phosphomannomutase/phosphoglucomutase [Gemmatimonadaceae bacterium]|nr:phosphomannomutase/phosphoglucomutase [Gemmatimonadaceae bacterium]